MDVSLAVWGCRVSVDGRITTRKRAMQNHLDKPRQELFNDTRRKACKEDTACAIGATMTVSISKV